jgi:hydrogenase maturation protease
VVVIGVGNELRGDDAAGIAVACAVRDDVHRTQSGAIAIRELGGDPAALLEAWDGHEAVIVVDAMRSGSAPGTIRRVDIRRDALPGRRGQSSSTHGIGLEQTIELARALDRLPPVLIVYGIEGARFGIGTGLSGEVEAAVPRLAGIILSECRTLRNPTWPSTAPP